MTKNGQRTATARERVILFSSAIARERVLVSSLPQPAWPTSPDEAIELQKRLAGNVRVEPLPRPARIIAAVDLSPIGNPRRPTRQAAGVIVYDLETGSVVERRALIRPVTFPYVPGLLSFREAPAALDVIARIKTPIDVFLIDGQGQAHPRRFGVACHIGVLIDRPTVGCAKSRLVGIPRRTLPAARGSHVPLVHQNRIVGELVRTRTNVSPLYVSVGHRITLHQSVDLVLNAADRYRLPEPARLAHNYVTLVAKGIIEPEE